MLNSCRDFQRTVLANVSEMKAVQKKRRGHGKSN